MLKPVIGPMHDVQEIVFVEQKYTARRVRHVSNMGKNPELGSTRQSWLPNGIDIYTPSLLIRDTSSAVTRGN